MGEWAVSCGHSQTPGHVSTITDCPRPRTVVCAQLHWGVHAASVLLDLSQGHGEHSDGGAGGIDDPVPVKAQERQRDLRCRRRRVRPRGQLAQPLPRVRVVERHIRPRAHRHNVGVDVHSREQVDGLHRI